MADLLESLPTADWDQPSLCADWTVRDVAAHLTFAQAGVFDVIWPMIRTGFRFNAMISYSATHSRLSHQQIVDALRGFVGSRRTAPMVSEMEPLLDILVHSQDICLPLGIDHPMPVDAAAAAATRVVGTRWPLRLWSQPNGHRLVATDTPWSHGEGESIEAPIQDHLLALVGRR